MRRSQPRQVSFVVRLWLESFDAAGRAHWRLQARHVQSGEQVYGQTVEDLLAFVERQAGLPGPSMHSGVERAKEEVER